MTHEKLKQFFNERPSLNIRGIETECGWKCSNTINKYISGQLKITNKFIEKVKPVLVKYGYVSE